MQTPVRLRDGQARRLAVRAGGLDRPRPSRIDVRHFRRVMDDVDVVQLDSVNVVDRAHRLVFFARLGPHDREALDAWLWRSREVHECWAHVASLMSMQAWPLLAHRRAQFDTHPWKGVQQVVDERPDYVHRVLEQVQAHGPVTVSDLRDAGGRDDGYWGWRPGKKVLHWLFLSGHTAVDRRDANFRAAWDLPERIVPADALARAPVPHHEAITRLAVRALQAQGVATTASLADHHRLPVRETGAALARLQQGGRVVEALVDGWGEPGWMLADTVIPRKVEGRALVAPFDPLVWFRPRVEQLFRMRYRIEIYVPEARREYGYYVLPFLLGDQLVARVDLKADRNNQRLVVRGAWAQPDMDHTHVARHLAEELRSLALHTVGSDDLEVGVNGDLAPALSTRA